MLGGEAVYVYPTSIPDTCLCWNYPHSGETTTCDTIWRMCRLEGYI